MKLSLIFITMIFLLLGCGASLEELFAPGLDLGNASLTFGLTAESTAASADLSRCVVNFTCPLKLYVSNVGSAVATDLGISASSPYGIYGGTFPGTGGTCEGFLRKQETCTVVLSFAATDTEAKPGTVSITYKSKGNAGSTPLNVTAQGIANSAVGGRWLFYNGSAYDGSSSDLNASDDAAIDTSKTALRAGGTGALANFSSYVNGITGVMVDLYYLPGDVPITASDFNFRTGNDNTPSGWSEATAPTAVSVRSVGTVPATARVSIAWANNAVQNTWLRILTSATANTMLSTADIFYFGNRRGDVSGNGSTSALDINLVNQFITANGSSTVAVTEQKDVDKSSIVDSTDVTLVTNAQAFPPNTNITMITPP